MNIIEIDSEKTRFMTKPNMTFSAQLSFFI